MGDWAGGGGGPGRGGTGQVEPGHGLISLNATETSCNRVRIFCMFYEQFHQTVGVFARNHPRPSMIHQHAVKRYPNC